MDGGYYVGWVLLLVGIGSWMKFLETTGHPDFFFGVAYWRYALMGALGGMTVAIWGLSVHSVSLDFDRAFTVWYWLKPLLGGVMGMIVVMTAQAGLLAVQGQGALPSSASGRMILYILAFLAGFSERFFVGIIDRVMTALLNSGQSASTPKAAPAKAPTPNR